MKFGRGLSYDRNRHNITDIKHFNYIDIILDNLWLIQENLTNSRSKSLNHCVAENLHPFLIPDAFSNAVKCSEVQFAMLSSKPTNP